MAAIKRFFEERRLLTGVVALLLIGVTAFGSYRWNQQSRQAQEEDDLQTATVRRGDLIIYASGTSTLEAGQVYSLDFGGTAEVSALYVEAGDFVQAGELLAERSDIERLEAQLATDELALLEAQRELEMLEVSAEISRAEAARKVAEAQEALEKAEYQQLVNQEGNRASSTTIRAAEAELVLAEQAVERAKGDYDSIGGNSDDPRKAQAYKDLAAAEQRYQTALISLNWYTGRPDEIEQAQLEAEVALAEAELRLAQQQYDYVVDGVDPVDQQRVEATLAQAQAALAASEEELAKALMTAPIDGVILSVSAEIGEAVSGTLITMMDPSDLQATFNMDENDASLVKLGYQAEVVFDALPNQILSGEVVQLDPMLSNQANLSTIQGTIALEPISEDIRGDLILGMGGAVDIIAGRAENTLLIPVEALRQIDDGEYAVFVMKEGSPTLTLVEVGLQDITFAEITSGLQVGDVVTTGQVETQ